MPDRRLLRRRASRRASRREFLGALAGASALGLTRCGDPPPETPEPKAEPAPPPNIAPPEPSPEPAAADDDAALAKMIGGLLLVGFRGARAKEGDIVLRDIAERHLGGVLLFDRDDILGDHKRNIESPAQLRALCGELQAVAERTVLIAIDQEGGYVNRLLPKYGFPRTESARHFGRKDKPDYTERAATKTAALLAEAGVNLNLAPVVDLMVNQRNPIIGKVERSYSADPEVVVRHASAFITAHHARGVLCSLKHFPGHGSSRADSHLGFVDISDTWTRRELEPFAALIKAGLADTVMTGHLFNKTLDPDVPATLSRAVITGLLREQLGFSGVVISDDLQMGAITSAYSFEQALRRALAAGVDLLTIGNNVGYSPDTVARAVEIIGEHVSAGRLERAAVEAAHARVLALRDRAARAPAPEADAPA
ncbi:MAG: glycoside hydrolase family 3 protein [Myxococcales bacterium]|nr:glycoside hydrolase family 3 protein [Myxococcales bacterium]